MKTMLSVDWDFFVPEKLDWDMGHQESLLFLKALWSTRFQLHEEMKTDGREVGFWKWVDSWADSSGAFLVVSDSHCYAYGVARGFGRIILVDAHHDCWPVAREGQVACHDWLRIWLERNRKRKATWIHPGAERIEGCPLPDDMADRVTLRTVDGSMPKIKLDTIHICRSGCWTPPWLDGAFIQFVGELEASMGKAMPLQSGDWDPMVPRWSKEDFELAKAQMLQIQEIMAKHRSGH